MTIPFYTKHSQFPRYELLNETKLFTPAASQAAMLAWIFGDCRENRIPSSLLRDIRLTKRSD